MTSPPKRSGGAAAARIMESTSFSPPENIAPNSAGANGALKKFLRRFPIISQATVSEVSERGLLTVSGNGEWRFGDSNNGTTRRLDHPKFKRSDTKGGDWHGLIGLEDVVKQNRERVIFICEGPTDAMAAFELAHRAGILRDVGVVAALGAGYRPIPSELAQLAGRKVIVIGDRDREGIESVRRVSAALCSHGVAHVSMNWSSFPKCDGKDLFDLLKTLNGEKPSLFSQFFLFFPPSNGSTVQRFNSSTHAAGTVLGGGFNSSTHVRELVEPFVVQKRGSGNAMAFALARALRGHEAATNTVLMDTDIDAVFHHWFTKSQPLLPPDADEERSLRHFYKQLRRVRYLPCALDDAIQRARTMPLPDIPGANTNVLKVAALMRELQRDAGDKSFICPVNVIVSFVPLRFAEQAKRVLLVLEKAGVIECVEHGSPHLAGKPGKSSVWRYKL
jgi:hypothetical protein